MRCAALTWTPTNSGGATDQECFANQDYVETETSTIMMNKCGGKSEN